MIRPDVNYIINNIKRGDTFDNTLGNETTVTTVRRNRETGLLTSISCKTDLSKWLVRGYKLKYMVTHDRYTNFSTLHREQEENSAAALNSAFKKFWTKLVVGQIISIRYISSITTTCKVIERTIGSLSLERYCNDENDKVIYASSHVKELWRRGEIKLETNKRYLELFETNTKTKTNEKSRITETKQRETGGVKGTIPGRRGQITTTKGYTGNTVMYQAVRGKISSTEISKSTFTF